MSENGEQISALNIQMTYNVTRDSILAPYSVSSTYPHLLESEDRGTRFLRNACNCLPLSTSQHPRRLEASLLPH